MVNLSPYGEKTDLPLGCKSQGYKYLNNYLLKGATSWEETYIKQEIISLPLSLSLHYLSPKHWLDPRRGLPWKNTRSRPFCMTRRRRVIIARSAVPQPNISPSFHLISSSFFPKHNSKFKSAQGKKTKQNRFYLPPWLQQRWQTFGLS